MDADEDMLSASTMSDMLSTILEEYVTIWTTFLLGGVASAGCTVVAGASSGCEPTMIFGIDLADCALSGLCGSSAPVASGVVASDRIDSLLVFWPRTGPWGETAVEADKCRRVLAPANECGRCEFEERAFRAGSMRTVFSMHISWVYELNLSCHQLGRVHIGDGVYPCPILIAFVYGARNDMLELPDEPPFLGALFARLRNM